MACLGLVVSKKPSQAEREPQSGGNSKKARVWNGMNKSKSGRKGMNSKTQGEGDTTGLWF